MKKILLITLLLVNFFVANAFTTITDYRWRNDNGTETSATWVADKNTPIQINNLNPIRLRVAITNNFSNTVSLNKQLEFSANDGQTWQNVSDVGSPFELVSSSVVNDGTGTTAQISSSTPFVGGWFISQSDNTTFNLPQNTSTEFEFSLKINSQYIQNSLTYKLRPSNSSGDYAVISYCPDAVPAPVVLSPQNFNVNANAKVSDLQATGTNLKWYTAISGGTALDPTTSLLTGLYYVSQTVSCESLRIEVQVNILKDGAALNFEGGYVDLPFKMPTTYTKEAWINISDFTPVNNIISGGGQDEHAIYVPGGVLSAGHNGDWNAVKDTETLDLEEWYHVAVTYDLATTTMKLYKNGVAIAENNNVLAFTGNAVRIGAFDPQSNLFNGLMDEARIWNKVLSATEIQDNMNCELSGPQAGLVAYYKFNQGVEGADNSLVNTLKDSSGNENDGTLIDFDLSDTAYNWVTSSIIQTGTTCVTLSIDNRNPDFNSSLKVYPNPSSSAFFINSDSNGTVVLFDLLGKVIQTQKLNSGTTTLNLGSTPNGVYLLKVTNENNQSKTVKLIKN